MNKIYILVIVLSLFITSNCSTNTVIEQSEQLVFENLKSCICDTSISNQYQKECKESLSDRFIIKNLSGIIYANDIRPNVIVIDYEVAKLIEVDKNRFPVWAKLQEYVLACNLPYQLKKTSTDMKVKFDINIFYESPPMAGKSIPQSNGYLVELLRIEIIK
jgi:hypothetical protein